MAGSSGLYVLEVVRFITEEDGPDGWLSKGGKLEHVGYMKAKFKTKKDACSYYDRHNPRMRSLNAHGTWQSDWDPRTNLLYIVRKDYGGMINTIPTFSPEEMPTISLGTGSMISEYPYLR